MIQYYLDLESQVKTIKESNLSGGQIQKIYSTAFYISMAIRTPGKTRHLYLGRGGGYEGIWIHDELPPSALRKKDNFLEYLRRYLSSCTLLNVELDNSDRIIKIDYQKYGKKETIMFFWKARKLYFLHVFQDGPERPFKLLKSWHQKAIVLDDLNKDMFSYFDEIGRRTDLVHDFTSSERVSMKELLIEESKNSDLKDIGGGATFLQRKKENIENDLRRAQQWERLQSLLERGEALDGYELRVGDHKIKFEGELNSYERRNLVFQKIKKLKRGEGILKERLKSVDEQLAGKEERSQKVSKLSIIRPVWGKEEVATKSSLEKISDEFRVFKNEFVHFGVGLNSQGNDQLRSKWASKDDYWFHLDGQKSTHVIVKLIKTSSLDPETINVAASLVASFSKFYGDWIPVIYTQVKNLKGVTGSAGMVIYKKEKHINCLRVDVGEWIKDLP